MRTQGNGSPGCGDVGFGKTEVAMRAAFIAAQNGRQSHSGPNYPIGQPAPRQLPGSVCRLAYTVEVVSRFQSAKDLEGIIARVQSGEVDILVGTHKLCRAILAFAISAF